VTALESATDFILRNARVLDRHRFARRFRDGPADAVVRALLPYRNEDGRFGQALEPDIRGPSSQPVPVEHALLILDAVDRFESGIVDGVLGWLTSVTTDEGGVPFVLESVDEAPHAEWWVPTGKASLNPTAGILGLLQKHDVQHPWISAAETYCWRALDDRLDDLGPDDAISVLTLLEHARDRERAAAVVARLHPRIVDELAALDPATPGYVKSPLEFAPHPDRLARRFFDDATIEMHLAALAAKQEADGGWPITWRPPSPAAVSEWRAFMTIKWLDVLDNYGRLIEE
jgi:hypothetical protein